MGRIFIGIDLGGTNTKIGLFNSELELICKTSIATKEEMGPADVVGRIGDTIEKLLTKNNLTIDAVDALGIGSPGPLSVGEGLIIAPPNLPRFRNTPLRDMVSNRFGKPAVLDNDANVACLGEYILGAGKGSGNMVFYTLGTGIGGGIISNGQLLHGSADNAAEIGHSIVYPNGRECGCGQKGCLEAYASATSMVKRTLEAIEAGGQSSLRELFEKQGEISCKDIYEHSAAGDELARKITDETAEALAISCVNMLHITEPTKMVFAGGVIAAGDMLLNRIRHFFNEYIWSLKKETVQICFATLGEDAGIIGAAALAREAI